MSLALFAVIIALAVGSAAAAAGRLVDRSADLLLPRDIPLDDRVVVVGYDDRLVDPAGSKPFPVPFSARSGVYMTDVTTLASTAGARAVVFVDYDSATLQEGAADRERLQQFPVVASLAIAPLHNLLLAGSPAGPFPQATRYRVDLLSASFAGIGAGLGQDQRDGSLVPLVVWTSDLRPSLFGTVRPSATAPSNNLVPSLALRAVQTSGASVLIEESRVVVDGRTVPLSQGRLRVNWSRRIDDVSDEAVITFDELLTGKVDPEVLAGKIVFVGITDPAAATLLHTPAGDLPPVLVHANAANTLLTGSYLRAVPVWASLAVLAATTALVLVLWRWRRSLAVVAALAVVAGWPVVGVVLAGRGWLVDLVTVPGAVLVTLGLLSGRNLVLARRERRRLRRLFQEYVPAAVADELIDSGRAQIAADGERHEVTVLFCDLRGFTPLAATLTPAQVRELLDTYYEALSPIVLEHGGTLLQYTGDEIYAAFGAPVAVGDHADRALACAVAFLDRQPVLAHALEARGLPAVHYGIGLHSGSVVAAHVGSSIRRQYSLLGDVVNVGNRCCSQARAGTVVYSDVTARLMAEPPAGVRDHGLVELKGVATPLRVWSVDRSPAGADAG